MRSVRKLLVGLALLFVALASTGCVATTATPAVHGRAYVVKGSIFGTSMYNCAVVNGDPQCWRVKEQNRGD